MPRPIAKNCKGIIATKRTKQDSLAGILVQECEPCAACTNNNNELQCSCSWSELLEPTDLSAYTRLDEFKDQPEKKKRKLSKIASAVLSHSIIRNTTNSAITKESSTSTNVECIPADSNIILDSDTGNGWAPFSLALPLLKALDTLGFAAPTPIQLQTLPVALKAQNVIGAAETVPITNLGLGKNSGIRPANPPDTRATAAIISRDIAWTHCFDFGSYPRTGHASVVSSNPSIR